MFRVEVVFMDLRKGRSVPKDGAPMPKIPQKDPRDIGAEPEQKSISLFDWQWKRLDEIAEKEGYTRNELLREIMRGGIDEWDRDHAGKKLGSSK